MARKGLNPYKVKPQEIPAAPDVSLCVVTHYTDDPYHKDRIGVIEMCLNSMVSGMGARKFELLIWDNGSSSRLLNSLRFSGEKTMLIESQNIGVHNAQHALAGLARGKVICMCDDDILFAPDWFEQQYKILTTYPHVGVVSGSPQRTAFRWATRANIHFTESYVGAKLQTGRLIPEKWEADYCLSVQRDIAQHMTTTALEQDALVEYKGVKAWAHGHHMQFMGYRDVVKKFLFQTPLYLADVRKHNRDLDAAGYLNLTTFERTAVHIGNVIDENIREIARVMGHEVQDGRNIPKVRGQVVSLAGSSA